MTSNNLFPLPLTSRWTILDSPGPIPFSSLHIYCPSWFSSASRNKSEPFDKLRTFPEGQRVCTGLHFISSPSPGNGRKKACTFPTYTEAKYRAISVLCRRLSRTHIPNFYDVFIEKSRQTTHHYWECINAIYTKKFMSFHYTCRFVPRYTGRRNSFSRAIQACLFPTRNTCVHRLMNPFWSN